MSNLQSTTLSQLPSDVWALMIAPVSKNTVSTMPIEDARKFVIESYLIYCKRAAEIALKNYKQAHTDWSEGKKKMNAHIKKMKNAGWTNSLPISVLDAAIIVQYDIFKERLIKLTQTKNELYKIYREARKNADPNTGLKLLAAAYGREHKIKKPFEIAAWQRVWQAEGTIKDLQWSLDLRQYELNESLIYLQDNIKQLEYQSECLANSSITIAELKNENDQLKKQLAEKSKKLVLITAKPKSAKSINKLLS